MKIKMLTTKSGPIASENWVEGEVRTVCDDEGNYWIQKGIAALHEQSIVAPIEKATIAPTQKAVIAPPEITEKVKVKADSVKQSVAPSASSNKAQTWGTPGVK